MSLKSHFPFLLVDVKQTKPDVHTSGFVIPKTFSILYQIKAVKGYTSQVSPLLSRSSTQE